MKALQQKRELALELRKQGKSLSDICKELSICKSSASVWTRGVELTEEQKQKLNEKNPCFRGQNNGAIWNKQHYAMLRKKYQEEGKQKAKEKNILHLAGCMLYWGEGEKGENTVGFSNSNLIMLKLFLKFVRNIFQITNDEITLSIHCYNDIHNVEEIENYWLENLKLSKCSLRKTIVNNRPTSSKKDGRKLEYGTCNIRINNTKIVQHIFGAIEEYGAFV